MILFAYKQKDEVKRKAFPSFFKKRKQLHVF